ncbi:MAG TPA: hypothetical protein VGE15_12980 [Sphingobacteriaceae bacterium]
MFTYFGYRPHQWLRILLLSALALPQYCIGQQENRRSDQIYFEAFGPGGIYSVNYDRRFDSRNSGFGARAGISYVAKGEKQWVAIPVQLNYLAGGKGHYFEAGAGLTFTTEPLKASSWAQNDSETKFFSTVNIGYRVQPESGGLTFRIGMSPLLTKSPLWYWPYTGLGYKF